MISGNKNRALETPILGQCSAEKKLDFGSCKSREFGTLAKSELTKIIPTFVIYYHRHIHGHVMEHPAYTTTKLFLDF